MLPVLLRRAMPAPEGAPVLGEIVGRGHGDAADEDDRLAVARDDASCSRRRRWWRPWAAPPPRLTRTIIGGALYGQPRGRRRPAVTSAGDDEHEASFSPDGNTIVFVRSVAETGGGTADDIYSVRPSAAPAWRA